MTTKENIINDIRNGKAMVVDTEWLQNHDKQMIDKACEWLLNNGRWILAMDDEMFVAEFRQELESNIN